MSERLLTSLSKREILQAIVHRPQWAILAVVVVSLFFAWHVPKLSIRTSIYDLVIEDLPETARYNDFKEVFGSDEIIRVVVKAENVFDPATFSKIGQLAGTATEIEGVRRVISLPGIKKDVETGSDWSLDKFAAMVTPVAVFNKNLILIHFGMIPLIYLPNKIQLKIILIFIDKILIHKIINNRIISKTIFILFLSNRIINNKIINSKILSKITFILIISK